MADDEEDYDIESLAAPPKSSGAAAGGGGGAGAGAGTGAGAGRAAREDSFLPWVEKYRPSDLGELISQNDIVNTITKLIEAGRLPHLLFYGPPGTGKTSTILALARRLYGPSYSSMVLELNASDDRGIDVVREQIKSFAGTRKLFSSGVKLVVLDEADAMTSDAQFALRRVIEKYTRTTRFCLICNYVSKIIPALQSRCTRFRFSPLQRDQIEGRLRSIVEREGLTARTSEDGLAAILRLAGGDMRKVLNVLQATASGFERVDADAVYACTGAPAPADLDTALRALLNAEYPGAMAALSSLGTEKGLALGDLVTELAARVAALGLPPEPRRLLVERLADIEYRLASGVGEKAQAAALVGAFMQVREKMGEYEGAAGAAAGRPAGTRAGPPGSAGSR